MKVYIYCSGYKWVFKTGRRKLILAEEREFLYEFFMNGYIVGTVYIYSNEMQQLYKNSVLPIFYQMFTRPRVLVCIKRQFVNYSL